MADYLALRMSEGEIKSMSVLGLAYIGDAVFELMVRSWLCASGRLTARDMHEGTVRCVSARSQARAVSAVLPYLTEEEEGVFRRGRNARSKSLPRGATAREYHAATGVEALFGYLYLKGETKRLGELFEAMISGQGV